MLIKWYEHKVTGPRVEDVEHVLHEETVEDRGAAVQRIADLFRTGADGQSKEGATSVHSDTLELLTPRERFRVTGSRS